MSTKKLLYSILLGLLVLPGLMGVSLAEPKTTLDDGTEEDLLPLITPILQPRVIVQLNDEKNVATVKKAGKEYLIDISDNPNAVLDEKSIDIIKASRMNQSNYPQCYSFTDGLLRFTITGLDPNLGESVAVKLTFPTDYPVKSKFF